MLSQLDHKYPSDKKDKSIRILVLIISSPGDAYNRLKANWRICANSHPFIDTYFMEMCEDHPNFNTVNDNFEEDQTLIFKGTDSIVLGCLHKTIRSLQILDLTKYDYIVRTNLSSVVHYDRIYKFLSDNITPSEKYYAGVILHGAGTTTGLSMKISFCSGALFIMSSDVADIVSQINNYENTIMYDDVHIAHHIQTYYSSIGGISLSSLHRLDNQLTIDDTKCFHYRFRTINRIKDTINHRIVMDKIYKKPKRIIKQVPLNIYKETESVLIECGLNCSSFVGYGTDDLTPYWILLKALSESSSVMGCTTSIDNLYQGPISQSRITRQWTTKQLTLGKLNDKPYGRKQFNPSGSLRLRLNGTPKLFILCDPKLNMMASLAKAVRKIGCRFIFTRGHYNHVNLPKADFYFINHVDDDLKYQLNRYRTLATKYIVVNINNKTDNREIHCLLGTEWQNIFTTDEIIVYIRTIKYIN